MIHYRSLVRTTLILIYLVIVAGGVVRMTGSGMGCPDWPKCFGMWIPPTDVAQLPPNYQETYSESYGDTTFNVAHTWTEYINRLAGALAGIFVLAVAIWSLKYREQRRILVGLCWLQVFLMGFQGWMGSVVVASNLQPVKITMHMLVALVIVIVQLRILFECSEKRAATSLNDSLFLKVLWVAIGLSLIQIVLGTQVRQQIDEIALAFDHVNRQSWIAELDIMFYVHRSFSVLVLIANGFLFFRSKLLNLPLGPMNALLVIILFEIMAGIVMTYASIPAVMQPVHLVLATVMFGVQCWVLMSNKWWCIR